MERSRWKGQETVGISTGAGSGVSLGRPLVDSIRYLKMSGETVKTSQKQLWEGWGVGPAFP